VSGTVGAFPSPLAPKEGMLTDGIRAIGIAPVANWSIRPRRLVQSKRPERRYALVAWLSLIGVLLPPKEMSVLVGVNFTPGRICLVLLLFPALSTLFAKNYRPQWSDFFAFATAAWIAISAVYVAGFDVLFAAAGGESLEFLGAYLVGRAFLGGPKALATFVGVLKIVTVAVVLLALADTISGRWIVQDTLGALFNATPPEPAYRNNMVRATATLDHPILLGTFLSLASAIIINLGGSTWSRTILVLVCLFGCILSQSSAALISWSIVVAAYSYDRLLKDCQWRWKAFWIVVAGLMCIMFLVANAPLGWLITHLTLDPESAYFRYLIWDAAFGQIAQAPFTGVALNQMSADILNFTIDCVWLAHAVRFGLPMIFFLFLANITAMLPSYRNRKIAADGLTEESRRAFSAVLVLFMFAGLTVHFWNYMWIFWGLCLGIRASLRLQPT
jgi:hypothetical protein